MTLAQVLRTLGPAEQQAVQAVYVDRLTFVAAAAQLSIDQATLGATLAGAFRAVARWVDTPGGEGAMAPVLQSATSRGEVPRRRLDPQP